MGKLNRRVSLCACGCSKYVKPDRKFISGHNMKGKKRTGESLRKLAETNALPETKARRSAAQKIAQNKPETKLRNSIGVKKSCAKPEIKAKRSASQKIAANKPERIKKFVVSLKIANAKSEVKEKRKQGQMIANAKPGVKERKSSASKEVAARPGLKERKSLAQKENWQKPDYAERVKKTLQITNAKPEIKAKRSAIQKTIQNRPEVKAKKVATMNKPEAKAKRSKQQKENWQNPEYVEKQKISQNISPNKLESSLDNTLINRFPKEYKYTGDFSVTIGGKCPDFININGQKKIIEIYGDYWHQNDNPQDRIDLFAQYGYDTLIIWEHELKDVEKLHATLDEFHHRENQYSKHKE